MTLQRCIKPVLIIQIVILFRELLWTLSNEELILLEKYLCSTEESLILQRSMSTSSQTDNCAEVSSDGFDGAAEGDLMDVISVQQMVHSMSSVTVVPFNCDGVINYQDSGYSGLFSEVIGGLSLFKQSRCISSSTF